MAVYDRILKHYLILALESAGVKLNGDCYTELDTIAISLEHEMTRIARDVAQVEIARAIAKAELEQGPPGEYITAQDDYPIDWPPDA